MSDYPALLNTDYYRISHIQQYPEGIQEATAYLTPRTCRIKGYGMENGPVVFGIQGFIKKYLIDEMNKWFQLSKADALKQISDGWNERVICDELAYLNEEKPNENNICKFED